MKLIIVRLGLFKIKIMQTAGHDGVHICIGFKASLKKILREGKKKEREKEGGREESKNEGRQGRQSSL